MFSHFHLPLSVTFVTAIVTLGCLSPTMHCNLSVPLARGGTAVTSTEREEERRKDQMWGEGVVLEEKKNEKKKDGGKAEADSWGTFNLNCIQLKSFFF